MRASGAASCRASAIASRPPWCPSTPTNTFLNAPLERAGREERSADRVTIRRRLRQAGVSRLPWGTAVSRSKVRTARDADFDNHFEVANDKPRRALLCYDGSEDAEAAIRHAAELLVSQAAVVLSVWEPAALWAPYDPATILSAAVSKLGSQALDLDELAKEAASEKLEQGVVLAQQAGFEAEGRLANGKAWRAICQVASEIDAESIVLGARGLSRVGSMLLGGVSSAVAIHAKRPVLVVPYAAS